MTSHIEIRFASAKDIPNVTEFALIALNDSSMLAKFAQDIGSEFTHRLETTGPSNTILALDKNDNNAIVGFSEVDPERSKPGSHYFLSGLYVVPSHRNQGIASKLVKKMLQEKCSGGEELIVKAFNDAEKKVWEKLLFSVKSTTLSMKL
jgi:ribosomal protein S18 acetylase RimI-like enzyme